MSWTLQDTSEDNNITLWTSDWICPDRDYVELDIDKDGSFNLRCFSGSLASDIHLDEADFLSVWNKFVEDDISGYSFKEQCFKLADALCERLGLEKVER